MSDSNFLAARLAKANAEANRVDADSVCGDGLSPFPAGAFDLILLNPPIRAGKETVMALLKDGIDRLAPAGELCFVVRTKQGAQSLRRSLESAGAGVEEIDKGSGYRVYCARPRRDPGPSSPKEML
jgi:16S rRNA (guanine1207-N2)-methyltransferase